VAIKGNIVIDQYADFTAQVDLDAANNAPLDLTDYTVQGSMKKSYASTANVQFTGEVLETSNGIIEISLTSTQTGNITPGRYVYDVIIIDGVSNTVSRVVEGIATVTPGISAR